METEAVAATLARLEVKMDQLLMDANDHEQRLRKLEERRWPIPIVSAVVSVLSAATVIIGMVAQR